MSMYNELKCWALHVDIGEDVLKLCESNLRANIDVEVSLNSADTSANASGRVRWLDWTEDEFKTGTNYKLPHLIFAC